MRFYPAAVHMILRVCTRNTWFLLLRPACTAHPRLPVAGPFRRHAKKAKHFAQPKRYCFPHLSLTAVFFLVQQYEYSYRCSRQHRYSTRYNYTDWYLVVGDYLLLCPGVTCSSLQEYFVYEYHIIYKSKEVSCCTAVHLPRDYRRVLYFLFSCFPLFSFLVPTDRPAVVQSTRHQEIRDEKYEFICRAVIVRQYSCRQQQLMADISALADFISRQHSQNMQQQQ